MSRHSYANSFCRYSIVLIALIVLAGWPRAVGASPCKADGQACRTNQSCCGAVCVNSAPPGKRPFGACCTPTTCAPAQCGLIADGSCPDMLNCGDCPSGEICDAGTCATCAECGAGCSPGVPCCSGTICDAGTCVACAESGAGCGLGVPCCSGQACNGGVCP